MQEPISKYTRNQLTTSTIDFEIISQTPRKIDVSHEHDIQIFESPVSAAKTPEISDIEHERIHDSFDGLIEISKTWKLMETPLDLLIKSEAELKLIHEYRILLKLKSELFTKQITDDLITRSSSVFESRNDEKKKNNVNRKSFLGRKKT